MILTKRFISLSKLTIGNRITELSALHNSTCRLMPPLFFLAMKTNVNYSPITSFIVQNEDAKYISEALSRIKQYISVDGIDIKNFMIDCSPTEMQSIREVFPDCGLYLCNFHRNQCWGRWFRTTWHGVSQHYELLMSTF